MIRRSKYSDVTSTALRKLRKSLDQRGVRGTAARCVVRPMVYAVSYLKELTPETRRRRRADDAYDSTHGVDTCARYNPGWMTDIESPNWVHGRGYHPAPIDSLRSTLNELPIECDNFTFIDFGSGKGRSLLLAAEFPFAEVIGVEYSAHLHETAVQNIANFSSSSQRCTRLRSVLQDAATYEIPPGPLVLYFYDPFAEPLMREVVDRINQALDASPRPAVFVYYNPVFAEMFEGASRWKRIAQGTEFESYWERTLRGNKEANEFASDKLDGERYVVYASLEQAS